MGNLTLSLSLCDSVVCTSISQYHSLSNEGRHENYFSSFPPHLSTTATTTTSTTTTCHSLKKLVLVSLRPHHFIDFTTILVSFGVGGVSVIVYFHGRDGDIDGIHGPGF